MTLKVALVTGSARRIGAAIVRDLHRQGYKVLIHYHRSQVEAQKLLDELNAQRKHSARGVSVDLLDDDAISLITQGLTETWGRCDLLVNNASSFYPKQLGDYSGDDWDALMGSNLKAPFFLSQALAPLLKQSAGSIINIADINAFKPRENYALYCIAKAGNAMMTRALALELAPNIRVNGIAPGAILWPEDDALKEVPAPEKLHDIPLGQLGGAQSICNAVNFLADPNCHITGEIIKVDGGQSVK